MIVQNLSNTLQIKTLILIYYLQTKSSTPELLYNKNYFEIDVKYEPSKYKHDPEKHPSHSRCKIRCIRVRLGRFFCLCLCCVIRSPHRRYMYLIYIFTYDLNKLSR